MKTPKIYIGIDVSKLSFDVAIESGSGHLHYKFENNEKGFKALQRLFPKEHSLHLVMEASGTYYLALASYFYDQSISVSVVNPLIIHRFCQMRMIKAKTDKKDAEMIARYGRAETPALWQPDPAYVLELRQIEATLEGYIKTRRVMENQLEAFIHNTVMSREAIKSLKRSIMYVAKEIASLEKRMEELVSAYNGTLLTNLITIPGLGKKTAMVLIVATGAFKKFSDSKQLSAYFGLSPRIYESGTSVRGRARITRMGMSKVRALLYLCAWSAKKCNKACRELYDRLVEKGKSKRLALIAVANKLLRQAFAIATKNTQYQSIP